MALKAPSAYILVALALVSLFLYYRHTASTNSLSHTYLPSHHHPANSTLGFGAIYVVSGPGSPRRDGLVQSANVTRLDFTVPELPAWTQQQVDDFRDADNLDKSSIADGSIKAWLSHNVALRDFLRSGHESALFLEDDVDWDIRLRTRQIPLVAAAMRSLMPPTPGQDDVYPWGDARDWELIYLGHCGDYFGIVDADHLGVGFLHPEDLQRLPHVLYRDPSLPDPSDLHPFTASFLTAFNIPAKTRVLHRSKFPLCTFAYALTRSAAQKLIDELAPPKEIPGRWVRAYDIAILEACRDRGLRCYSLSPELFHHMEGTSLIDGERGKAGKPPADRAGSDQVHFRNETSNIGCGFWSGDFRWDGDVERLAFLREEVGRKGKCLKPGRAEDGSRLGPLPVVVAE